MADTSPVAELLPCPFCGGVARIESNRDWHRLYAAHDEECVFDADDHALMYPAQLGYLIQIAKDWNRRAALASRPAEVDDEGLPPLPDAWHGFRFNSGWGTWEQVSHWAIGDEDVTRAYTAEQFRQGQRDAREYQRKVGEKIIARRDQEIADLRFNIGELMKAVAPSHTTNKEK